MVDFQIGQIVFSKRGRDKGAPFIILSMDNEYLYLADGKLRSHTKPKKKKIKHVQPTNTVSGAVTSAVDSGSLLDSDLRKAIKEFEDKEHVHLAKP